jgi:hypothetical protein
MFYGLLLEFNENERASSSKNFYFPGLSGKADEASTLFPP